MKHAEADGTETTTLLLLPGLDGTDVFFRPLQALLPASMRVIAFSYPDGGPYDYAALLERVRAELADVPGCHVLATSFSGPLAVMLAAVEPDKILGVILAASFLRTPRRRPAPLRLIARAPLVKALRVARRLPVWLLRGRQDAFRTAKRETWARASARGLAGRGRAVLDVDVRALLRVCTQPVLCVAYADDRVVPRRYMEEIGLYSAAARLVTLPGGHHGYFGNPAALAAEILGFVECDR